ncbi:hypothetical protein Vadar_032679 [Vaccinium darrowii]|uniref:Uncharacterized protein n=1 Tax=Vaccinium darrowii TaxID=229202 RepID=A0ACB7YIT1_9ERIC|nr:hypothetical protein Vadar_032679 [Vaccinium darrowii]
MAEFPHQNPLAPHQVPQGPLQIPHVLHQDPQVPPQGQEIPVPKKSRGRQRVDMSQKMQNEANLQVTFSKRRNGLFKKCSELVTLCGVELIMIIFSPKGKPYSFGHPSVDNIIDRFLTGIPAPPNPSDNIMAAQRNENLHLRNMQLTQAQAMLEAETRRDLELQHSMAVRRTQHRWEAPLEEQSHDEILQLRAALQALQVAVAMETERRTQEEQQQNPLAFQALPSASSSFRVGGNVIPPFPPIPNPFGEGVSGFPQFLDGPSSSGGVGSTGLNYFRGSSSTGALPFSAGASSGSFPQFSQFSTGSASVGVGGTLPFSTWSTGSSSTGVAGSSGFSGGPGGLPPFPGEATSSGHGGAVPFPPGPSSFGRGGALQFPPGPSSFEQGDGNGSGDGGPSSSRPRRGRGVHVREVHFRGFGRGRGRRPSGSGRGS